VAHELDGISGAAERVGDHAAVVGGHGGHGVAVGERHHDVAGDRLGVVEGGEAGEGGAVGVAGGAEVEGGHERMVGLRSVYVQRQLLDQTCKFN
jgi:hypothetical protein